PAGRELAALALRMLDVIDRELAPLDRALCSLARRQPGCRALIERLYGVGVVSATAILAELGDRRRFGSSDDAVRHSGLDVTVYQSDSKRAPGHLSHEGRKRCAGRCSKQPSRPPAAPPRPPLFLPAAGAARRQPRLPLGCAQALPPGLPHPARA